MSNSLTQNLPSTCQTYQPEQDTSNAGNMGSQLLKQLGGTQSCDLTSYYAALAGKTSAGPAGMLGSAEFAGQMNGLKKSGCQVLAAVVGNYLNSIYQSRCFIENDATSSTTNTTISQNANINVSGPGSKFTCSKLDINQKAGMSVKSLTNISSSTDSTIASITQAGLATTAKQIGQIKDGYQGTDSGAKFLQTIQNKLVQQSQSTQIKDAITAVVNNYSVDQNGIINVTGGGVFTVDRACNLDQNAIIDLQLANIISNAYTSSVTDSIKQFVTGDQGQAASILSGGAPNVVGAFLENNWMYIIGAIAAVILGVFLLKFLKSKNAGKIIDTVAKNPELLKMKFGGRYY